MNNFTYHVQTRINFGREQLSHLAELRESGKKVLYVYGGGSIKKSGLYDKTMKILKDAGLEVFELSGVEPNPRIETVRKGARLCKDNGIEMVLAVGGGSAIDCSKVIAGAICTACTYWICISWNFCCWWNNNITFTICTACTYWICIGWNFCCWWCNQVACTICTACTYWICVGWDFYSWWNNNITFTI